MQKITQKEKITVKKKEKVKMLENMKKLFSTILLKLKKDVSVKKLNTEKVF